MILKVKKLHKNAVIPSYAHKDDVGMDLTVVDVEPMGWFKVKYKFGICVEPPSNYYLKLYSRSSVFKTLQWLSNGTGIIDNGYRGEIKAVFYRLPFLSTLFQIGERACQFTLEKQFKIDIKETQLLSDTERGSAGYGSSGK